jgi:CBS-domain-containing membrane protein
MKVKKLMRTKPKTVYVDTPLSTVWQLLQDQKTHILPVVDNTNRIHGIITAEDLLLNLVKDYRDYFSDFFPTGPSLEEVSKDIEDQVHMTAKDIMNRTVYTAHVDYDASKALARMMVYGKRILPVIDDDKILVGFIVEKDIFKYLFAKQKKVFNRIKKQNQKNTKK